MREREYVPSGKDYYVVLSDVPHSVVRTAESLNKLYYGNIIDLIDSHEGSSSIKRRIVSSDNLSEYVKEELEDYSNQLSLDDIEKDLKKMRDKIITFPF